MTTVSLPVVTTEGDSPTGLVAAGTISAPPPFYLYGWRLSDFTCITIEFNNNDPYARMYAVGNPSIANLGGTIELGAYVQAAVSDAQSALSSFLTTVGYPWIPVGSLADMTWVNGWAGVVAVNLDHENFEFSDGAGDPRSAGIKFSYYREPSFGYAPWTDYADAAAGIEALVRNVTWSPSS